jgi:Mrp family chromosome partitioning ATPase
MTAGGTAGDAYALLQSPRFGVLFDAARARFDCVIVDTPPILPVPDGRLIAPLVDAVLLVVAAHETPRALVEAALDATEPEKLAGFVFNGDAGPLSEYRHYYSPYYASPSAKADRHAR